MWEPYSDQFAEREIVARARSVSTIQVTYPRPKPAPKSTVEAVDDYEAEEHDEDFPVSPRPRDPGKEARCIAIAARWAQSREAIELAEEETLATRLVAAMNTSSTDVCGDDLDERPEDSLITASDEDRAIAAMSSTERGPVITKEILA
jgi:hypothetical protein